MVNPKNSRLYKVLIVSDKLMTKETYEITLEGADSKKSRRRIFFSAAPAGRASLSLFSYPTIVRKYKSRQKGYQGQ
jgi:hypothetical protein